MSTENGDQLLRTAFPLTIPNGYVTGVDAVIGKAGWAVDKVLSQEELTAEEKTRIAISIGEVIARHTSMVLVDGDEFFTAVSEVTIALNAGDITETTKQAVGSLQRMKGQAAATRNIR